MLPKHKVDLFVGPVKNHYKTDAIHLYDDRYRINVWVGDGFIKKIEASYFVTYDGEIVDKTKKKVL